NFVVEAKKKHETGITEMEVLRGEAQTILNGLRQISGEAGVLKMADYFDREAQRQGVLAASWYDLSKRMVGVLFGLALALFVLGYWITGSDTTQAIQIAVSKLILIGVVSYATFVCVKNFHSHTHLQSVNQHRFNA